MIRTPAAAMLPVLRVGERVGDRRPAVHHRDCPFVLTMPSIGRRRERTRGRGCHVRLGQHQASGVVMTAVFTSCAAPAGTGLLICTVKVTTPVAAAPTRPRLRRATVLASGS